MVNEAFPMNNGTFLETHLFLQKLPRRIEQDGGIVFLLHCSACGRDYVQAEPSTQWHAAYVGIFLVELLPKDVTERWFTQRCPGRRLEADANDRAKHSYQAAP